MHPALQRLRSPSAAGAAFLAALGAVVAARLAVDPIDPYGSNGATFIEHGQRVGAAIAVGRWWRGEEWWTFTQLIDSLDDAFPPMIHLVALPWTWLFAGRAEPVAFLGLFWALLLALAVGRVASELGARPRVAWFAAAATAALPGVHGAATKYYFDLPMSALCWASVAALLAWQRRPVAAGLAAGVFATMACLAKWTALPFLALMMPGAFFVGARGADWRRRILAAAVGGGLSAASLLSYLAVLDSDNSLDFTTRESAVEGGQQAGFGFGGAVGGLLATLLRSDPMRWARLEEHSRGLAFATFSPVLLAAGLVFSVVWLQRSRRGAPFILATGLGQLAFLVIWIAPVDERFHLTLAPALALAAALGWDRLRAPVRRATAVGLAAWSLLVAWDFHHGRDAAWTRWWTDAPVWGRAHDRYPPPQRPRGLGAATSAQGRGWVRRDEALPYRAGLRRAIAQRVATCDAEAWAALDGGEFVTDYGSHDWLGFEQLRSILAEPGREWTPVVVVNWLPHPDDQRPPGSSADEWVWACDPQDEPLPAGAVVFAPAPVDGPARPPACPESNRWRLLEAIPDPDGGRGTALWSPWGHDVCGGDYPRSAPPSDDDDSGAGEGEPGGSDDDDSGAGEGEPVGSDDDSGAAEGEPGGSDDDDSGAGDPGGSGDDSEAGDGESGRPADDSGVP